jgi:putative membrane protein
MNLRNKFSENDLERIKAAVRQAEENISGEIVPVIVSNSGHYTSAMYKGGVFAGIFMFILIIIFDRYVPALAVYDPLMIFFCVMMMGGLGALATQYIEPLKRLLVAQSQKDNATRLRAETAFLEEEIFNTRQRTGIMIFISFFEHEVMVIADTGISKVVEQKEWDKIVNTLTDHIRRDKIVEGLETSLKRCGEILLEKGFTKTADDINELRDDLRIN